MTTLTQDHLQQLVEGSAILPDVVRERACSSITTPAQLAARSFPDYQRRVPGILFPVHTTDGQVLPIVYRPDVPRLVGGKPRKYEQAEGSEVRLDCPPRCRAALMNPEVPLWITEGYKKGDSLASRGACVIDLAGVWGFRVPQKSDPRQPPLPDWKWVQLADRLVTIVFDSDVRTHPQVAQARDVLAQFLRSRGAHVRYCTLSPLPTGAKCGVDDYFVMGHSLADLEGLSSLSSLSSQPGEKTAEPVLASAEELNSLFSLNSQGKVALRAEAFHGVVGDLIRLVGPQTEADPAALLMQFLVYFGVLVGRQPYYLVGATRHYPNLFAILVGPTSKARKGSAYDHIDAVMKSVDSSWTLDNIISGCGSGEGLIHAVRDPVTKREPSKVKGKITGYNEVLTDPGVRDKRLLVHEPEFAAVLKVMHREGNILSMILRQAWDSGNLHNTVKTSPQRATDAHVALLGHVTLEELTKLLTTTEAANGFGNRFLWVTVQRSKLLPDGGALARVDMQAIVTAIRQAHAAAREVTQMRRDAQATRAWHTIYPTLSADQPGLSGNMLARGEAQVLRLSMLYALLDCSATIRVEHLTAALAVWEYAEASVHQAFGATTGNREADTLREALKWAEAGKMTKTEMISEVFHGHIKAHDLNTAIRLLAEEGIVTRQFAPSTGGRRKEYVCYGESPSRSLLPRARARYIELIGLSTQGDPPSATTTERCEESEESEESPSGAVDAPHGDNLRRCEESEESEESPSGAVDAPHGDNLRRCEASPPLSVPSPDCLPPPCAHPETQAERMDDGSTLIRCTTCRYLQVSAPERSA